MIKLMKRQNAAGFSLVELMVVVAIIGILASVAVPNFQRFQRKARQSEGRNLLGAIATSQEAFRAEWEQYHSDLDDIGFAPTGNLRYNIGFPALSAAPAAPFMTAGIGLVTTAAGCGNAMSILQNCTDASGMAALPGGAAAPAIAGLVRTYVAGASGNIGGAMVDQWTIDQTKNLTNTQDGTGNN